MFVRLFPIALLIAWLSLFTGNAWSQQATRGAAERIKDQAERARGRENPPAEQSETRQGRNTRSGKAEPAEAASSGISPAQGLVLTKLAKLGDVVGKPPTAKTTYVRGPDGQAQVARVICELNEKRMVKRPDGRLDFVLKTDTRPCDKPFRSATMHQIEAQMRAEGFDNFTFVRDGYYLYAYDCSEAFFHHTRSILSSMLSGVVTQLRDWGLEVKRPETPLVVVIFPNRSAFDQHDPMPAGIAAYYNAITNWVYLYENTELWDAAPEYAMKEYAYTVAHEGIHQVLHNTGIQQRLSQWPAWISEGLPEYFCPLRIRSSIVRQGKDHLPTRTLKWHGSGRVNDLRMYHLLRGQPGGDGKLVSTTISSNNLTAYGYAISWGLTHYLGQRDPDNLAKYLQELSQLQPLQGNLKSRHGTPDPLFVKHFGDDFVELENQVKRHLNSSRVQKQYRDPMANQTVYVVKRIYIKGRTSYTSLVLTRSPVAAREWRDQEKKRMDELGEQATFITVVCKNEDEARYQLNKLKK